MKRVFIDGTADTLPNPPLEKCLYENMKALPLPEYTPEERAYAEALRQTYVTEGLPGLGAKKDAAIAAQVEQLSDGGKKALNDFLRPEFLNRVDEIVYFNQLSEENFKDIARLMLTELQDVLAGKGMELSYDDSVVDYLAGKSYSVTYGARNLRRTIQKEIEDRIASAVVDERRGAVQRITLTAGEDGVQIGVE